MGPKLPKGKEITPKKQVPTLVRQPISDNSLLYVPQDAVEGFQERLEKCVVWTPVEEGAHYHKKNCKTKVKPKHSFSEALREKIQKSYLGGFLDDDSKMTLEQHWEVTLPLTIWDNEKCATKEGQVCFKSDNCITDNIMDLLKKMVRAGDKDSLKRNLKKVHVLRVTNSKMTELDEGLTTYHKLCTLNLCGNCLSDIEPSYFPKGLKILELQANAIRRVDGFISLLPPNLLYLGLSRNLLTNEGLEGLGQMHRNLIVLDLSDNDIYDLHPVLVALGSVPSITSLSLAGNPCSVAMGYARTTIAMLPRLRWLDNREILRTDRPLEHFEYHTDDLRSSYFYFNVIRIMSAPQPPKCEKGQTAFFHVELELPLLDSQRRHWLMYRTNDSLTEMLPAPEDEEWPPETEESKITVGPRKLSGLLKTKSMICLRKMLGKIANLPCVCVFSSEQSPEFSGDLQNVVLFDIFVARDLTTTLREAVSHESDVYAHLIAKNSNEIIHFTKFESNKVPWSKMMNFQEPTVKIFCPDLTALRNTFRSVITVRLVYTLVTSPLKPGGKPEKKSTLTMKAAASIPAEQYLVLASVKCPLQRTDWSQPAQHFHWDETMATNEAMHWGDGDLAVLQYTNVTGPVKPVKGGKDDSMKQQIPDNFTCHFGFGIERLFS